MSEPNSLFAKIKIKKDQFDEFLKSKPEQPKLNENWLKWWDSKKMYGKKELDSVYAYEEPTNNDIINGWIDVDYSLAFSDYDLEAETWHFGIVMFSENYYEIIPGLAFIKSVSEFKENDSNDFAIIYNYLNGDEQVCAYISYKNGEGVIENKIQHKSDVNADILRYTEEYLCKKWDEFEMDYDD